MLHQRPPDQDDDIFVSVASAVSCEIGEEFLSRVVEVLRGYMRASLVFIGIGHGTPVSRIRAIYALRDGQTAHDISYDLGGTPCELVYSDREAMVVPCDLAKQFPKEAGLESYVGVPLHDGDGNIQGHFAVFSTEEISDPARVGALLKVMAKRVEAELGRIALEAEREKLVDDLKRQATLLRQRQQTIRDQNAYKTRLLGIIAHDLRNPISAIISQTELAQMLIEKGDLPTDRVARICDKVMNNADRISSLIDATLSRVREEDGNLSLSLCQCDTAGLIRLAIDANLPEADRKSITLTVADLPAGHVQADEELLTTAVDNLISNAVKYTQPGGSVRISATFAPDVLRISVADNGQGLSESDKKRAFGRFQTLSAKPTGGESSTGLGLANVREIVDAHGGTISVRSDGIGQGAEFTIELPLQAPG